MIERVLGCKFYIPSFRTHRQYFFLKLVIRVLEKSVDLGLYF